MNLVRCEVAMEEHRGVRIIKEGGSSATMDQMVWMAVTEKQIRQSTHIFEVVKKSTKNKTFHKSSDNLNKSMHFTSLLYSERELIAF